MEPDWLIYNLCMVGGIRRQLDKALWLVGGLCEVLSWKFVINEAGVLVKIEECL